MPPECMVARMGSIGHGAPMEPSSARWPMPWVPNGWYGVLRSRELERGAARPLSVLGRELVAFRDAAGRVRVLDAYCPHYGAHLGHGGRVHGDTITCPFHGWRFDGDGACVHAPCVETPPRVRIPAHRVCERS